MTTIERLWEDSEVPIADALHYAEGHSYDVTLDPTTPCGFSTLSPFSLDKMMEADPFWVTEVNGLVITDLGDRGALLGGEGLFGADGFIARVTVERKLIWVIFFEESNPFTQIRVSGNIAIFHSTADYEITVDIDDPRNAIPQAGGNPPNAPASTC